MTELATEHCLSALIRNSFDQKKNQKAKMLKKWNWIGTEIHLYFKGPLSKLVFIHLVFYKLGGIK